MFFGIFCPVDATFILSPVHVSQAVTRQIHQCPSCGLLDPLASYSRMDLPFRAVVQAAGRSSGRHQVALRKRRRGAKVLLQ